MVLGSFKNVKLEFSCWHNALEPSGHLILFRPNQHPQVLPMGRMSTYHLADLIELLGYEGPGGGVRT